MGCPNRYLHLYHFRIIRTPYGVAVKFATINYRPGYNYANIMRVLILMDFLDLELISPLSPGTMYNANKHYHHYIIM